MTDLHLVITPPEPGDDDMPLSILRHPSGAVWAVLNESGDSGLDCPNGAVIEFPGDTPAVVVLAACLAATHTPA